MQTLFVFRGEARQTHVPYTRGWVAPCLRFVVCLLCDIQQLTHSRSFRHIAVRFIKHATENTMCELVCVCKRSLGNRNAHAVRLFFCVVYFCSFELPDSRSRFAGRNVAGFPFTICQP